MNQEERIFILNELAIINKVILSIDQDRTVCKTLEKIFQNFKNQYQLFFANGGDQKNESIPEVNTCKNLKIELIQGLGNKIQSSSWLLKK